LVILKNNSEKNYSEKNEDAMFVGREKELHMLRGEHSNWNKRTAVLVYGKRRVGKTTLIREVAKEFDGIVIAISA